MSGLVPGRVVERREWAPGLISLKLEAEVEPHVAGQFRNLGLELDGEPCLRSYSVASAPSDATQEFLIARVEGGLLTPRLTQLGVGDTALVSAKPQGFFTLKYVPEAKDLWCIATGAGLGPFMALVREGRLHERFERVVLVHGVRTSQELAYEQELQALSSERLRYLPALSRAQREGALSGRVTHALEQGALERAAGFELSPERSHVLLCGNPDMITEFSAGLARRGLKKHRVREPGHVSFEKYW